jgi:hypothetical protein
MIDDDEPNNLYQLGEPEQRRDVQLTIFPPSLKKVLEECGVSLLTAERLHEAGLLSFWPRDQFDTIADGRWYRVTLASPGAAADYAVRVATADRDPRALAHLGRVAIEALAAGYTQDDEE